MASDDLRLTTTEIAADANIGHRQARQAVTDLEHRQLVHVQRNQTIGLNTTPAVEVHVFLPGRWAEVADRHTEPTRADTGHREVRQVIADLAATGRPFCSNDLYDHLPATAKSSPNKIIPAAFAAAVKAGEIQAVGIMTAQRRSRTRIMAWQGYTPEPEPAAHPMPDPDPIPPAPEPDRHHNRPTNPTGPRSPDSSPARRSNGTDSHRH